jgi:DNA-binding MarR family transcriptional regulator
VATNRRLLLDVARVSGFVGSLVERQLEPFGLPAYLFALFSHIRHVAPVSPTAVSRQTGIPTTTLRDNIQRLVDRRLVRRVPHPDDRRSYLLELTRKGEVLARAADPALLKAYVALERRLPRPRSEYEQRLKELGDALAALLAAKESRPPARPARRSNRV